MTTEILAFDKSRLWKDVDGKLHREATPVTKANVCPYLGSEIPDAEALGLDPLRRYWLLRDPDELKKAVPSFNNLQILDEHVAVSAADHMPGSTVGSTGTDAAFDGEFIRVSVVIWAAESIEGIESKRKRELSSSYRYTADMTRGSYLGTQYDGVMRGISANHVAIVEVGRAGSDVLVSDSLPKELAAMKLTPFGNVVSGMVALSLAPKLAMDSKFTASPLLMGVTRANWKATLPTFKASLLSGTAGKLAKDASIDDVLDMLDRVESVVEELDEAETVDAPADDEAETDEEKAARMAARAKAAKDKAKDEFPEPKAKEKDEPKADPKEAKKAMDAAIADAVAKSVARMNGIAAAREAVRPHVGEVSLAMDSAESVYQYCLTAKGVNVAGVDASAYGAMVSMLASPQAAPLAYDAAGAGGARGVDAGQASLASRFPGVKFARKG